MATAVVARPVARPQARARDEEVLVWPDLVFVEFIAAMLFTVTLFFLSVVMNAPLLDQANADVTPNPSKAPWYLLNLQELLLHMNAAMAGIIIPTVWLGILAAFPYFDRDTDGQGAWFGTEGRRQAHRRKRHRRLRRHLGSHPLGLRQDRLLPQRLVRPFRWRPPPLPRKRPLDAVAAPLARVVARDHLPAVQPEACSMARARAARRRSSTSTSRAGSSNRASRLSPCSSAFHR
jgi:hypothetical protein